MFDLTTSGLSKNCNSMDRFLDEVELTPLYNVYVVNSILLLYSKIENNVFTFQKCVESKKNTEQETTSTNKSNKAISDEETIRQRKEPISKDSSSEWVEKEDASEVAFEEKIEAFKKDPLYILNSMPSNNQRKAQKTLQKSKLKFVIYYFIGFVLLCELCSMQKQIESLVNDYETLAKLEQKVVNEFFYLFLYSNSLLFHLFSI